jgi:hypothetical protein
MTGRDKSKSSWNGGGNNRGEGRREVGKEI